MLNPKAQHEPAPEPQSPGPGGPAEVAYLRPVPPPTLSRGRKVALTLLLVVTGLTLAAAGTSVAASPASSGDVTECATQCPM